MPTIQKLHLLNRKKLYCGISAHFAKDRILDLSPMLPFYFLLALFPLLFIRILMLSHLAERAVRNTFRESSPDPPQI